jgi:hypothetical protein
VALQLSDLYRKLLIQPQLLPTVSRTSKIANFRVS